MTARPTCANCSRRSKTRFKTWCGRLRKNLGPVPIERAEPLFKDSPLGQCAGAVEVFRQTWPDYTNGNSLPLAKQRAAQRSRHPIADKFPEFDPEISTVANICEELQALRGDRDFWFTIDDVAKAIEPTDPEKAREKARRIRNLLELGFLTVTKPGRGKQPTCYRLAAPRDETQTQTQIHPARD